MPLVGRGGAGTGKKIRQRQSIRLPFPLFADWSEVMGFIDV